MHLFFAMSTTVVTQVAFDASKTTVQTGDILQLTYRLFSSILERMEPRVYVSWKKGLSGCP